MYNFHTYCWAVCSSQESHIQQSQNTKQIYLGTYSKIISALAYSSGYGFSQDSATLYSFFYLSDLTVDPACSRRLDERTPEVP